MRKGSMLKTLVISLALVVMIFAIVPQAVVAQTPPEKLPPVYPTVEPADPDSETKPGAERTYETRDSSATVWNPYKEGTSAVGKARTLTNYVPLVWKHVYVDVWLWKWIGGEWVIVASNTGSYVICPPTCEIIRTAVKSGATSGSYCTTSRHQVFADNIPVFYAELSSDSVWLSF